MDSNVVPVGLIEVESDAYKCFRQLPQRDCQRPGAEVEIVQLAFTLMNLSWRVVDVEREFGIPPDLGVRLNETHWTGMMQLLAEGKVAMSGLSMHITPERMKHVLFAFPTRYFQTIYVMRRPNETYSQNFIVNAFPGVVWLALFGSFLVVWSIHVFYDLLFVAPKIRRRKEVLMTEGGRHAMQLVSANLRQTIPLTHTGSLAILNAFYMLALIVIVNYFQTTLFSNLVAPRFYRIPFQNRHELATALLQGKVFMTDVRRRRPYCAYQCDDLYRALESNPMRVRQRDSEVFRDIEENGVFQSKLDVNFVPTPFSWFSRRYDKIIVRDNREVTHFTAFAFAPQQRKLRRRFDQALLQLLPAVELITTAHGYRTRRRPFVPVEERHFLALSLGSHLLQVFAVYGIGIALAVLAFLTELLCRRFCFCDL